jgi:hypothetical protein
MAMSCTRESVEMGPFHNLALVAAAASVLSACAPGRVYMGADTGRAVALDERAQITDPDARYPAAVTDGARAALAYDRYRTGKVIEPPAATASRVGAAMGVSQ